MRVRNYGFVVVILGIIVGAATFYWHATQTSNVVLTPIATLVLFPGIVLTGGIHRNPPWLLLFAINWVFYVILSLYAIALIRTRS